MTIYKLIKKIKMTIRTSTLDFKPRQESYKQYFLWKQKSSLSQILIEPKHNHIKIKVKY